MVYVLFKDINFILENEERPGHFAPVFEGVQ